MIRTKIVCTIGPASRKPETLRELIQAGMDIARLNFSHGDHVYHARNIARIRAAARQTKKPVAVLVDLQGPKLRVGMMEGDGVPIHEGELIHLTTRPVSGHRLEGGPVAAVIPVQYQDLPRDIKADERILLDDGLMELVTLEVSGDTIVCRVVTGGLLQSNKGLNLPGTALSLPSMTDKDQVDLDFAIGQQVDWIALSFVRRAKDILSLKEAIAGRCASDKCIRVIAKIEKPEALDDIEEIIAVSDGIMIARGDLGIEIPPEKVPMVQKRLIQLANAAGKPVITATQMLDSMIRNPRPTRAEASDVANAILDGTDAIMLSGETATGKYPIEAVRTMVRIACEVEAATLAGPWRHPPHIPSSSGNVTDAVAHATCDTAYDLRAAAIITATASGATARAVARYRPHTPIIAVTPNRVVQRQLMLSWGVIPLHAGRAESTDRILRDSIRQATAAGLVRAGDRVVLTAGVANNMPGTTNLMTVELVPVSQPNK
jgi:pyruvate kinase